MVFTAALASLPLQTYAPCFKPTTNMLLLLFARPLHLVSTKKVTSFPLYFPNQIGHRIFMYYLKLCHHCIQIQRVHQAFLYCLYHQGIVCVCASPHVYNIGSFYIRMQKLCTCAQTTGNNKHNIMVMETENHFQSCKYSLFLYVYHINLQTMHWVQW